MKEILIDGGYALEGSVEISGSKNAALPVIFASVAIDGISVIKGVPDIGDVDVAIKIIERLGAKVERNENELIIDTTDVHYERIPRELTSMIRASSYLIGACLVRFGRFHLSEFGGCNFCNRPIDMHLMAAESFGAQEENGILFAKRLCGTEISFSKPSVGATINALIMASFAEGRTVLRGCAKEPHVKMLANFLRSAGASIIDDKDSFVINQATLSGGSVEIIPDMIEAGTYALMGVMTGGKISIKDYPSLELESFFSTLEESGISVLHRSGVISVFGTPYKPICVKTAPHPGYPTDLQPQIAPIMAKFSGGRIYENVWQNRFSYLDSLASFGVEFDAGDSSALIYHSNIRFGECCATDLRGGAAALILALAAEGRSKIKNAEVIFRGYSDIVSKLKKLGARIDVVKK